MKGNGSKDGHVDEPDRTASHSDVPEETGERSTPDENVTHQPPAVVQAGDPAPPEKSRFWKKPLIWIWGVLTLLNTVGGIDKSIHPTGETWMSRGYDLVKHLF
ncbi:hypothetical protein AB0F13_01415 [Streptomyces sp. NPDC026206]|uniref:hypothetical protein n=1 Tax=Streptomyces sp. NPDC026206 TaxID=3157089 RepID=UPI0033D3295E